LQKIILGNLPFLGISHQGKLKDREYREKFSNKEEIKKVLKVALQYEVRCFAASSHDFNELAPLYLDVIKEIEKEVETEIQLIPCLGVPLKFKGEKINDYRRWATHLKYESNKFGEETRRRYFEDPILNCRLGWRENLRVAKSYSAKELERELRIDWKRLEDTIHKFSDFNLVWIEPGSETDFLAVSRMDLLEELTDRIHEFGYRILLGSHHLGASAPLIQEENVRRFDGYVTPINKLGHMMFPTQREVENVLRNATKGGKLIVATKPFAGGRIEPKKALNYVYKEVKADSCMMGVGSVEEAKEDFRIAKNVLKLFNC